MSDGRQREQEREVGEEGGVRIPPEGASGMKPLRGWRARGRRDRHHAARDGVFDLAAVHEELQPYRRLSPVRPTRSRRSFRASDAREVG